MPTREEAVETLYSIINSGMLSDELTEKLEDIAKCISAEEDRGIFTIPANTENLEHSVQFLRFLIHNR